MRPLIRLTAAGLMFLSCGGSVDAAPDGNDETNRAAQASSAASPPDPVAETVLEPIENYNVIVERPLFMMGRRPSESDTAQLAAGTHFILALTGIIVEGGERQAIFRHRELQRPLRLSVGMSRQGWELLRIADDHVVFRQGTRSLRLALDYSRPTASARAQRDEPADPTQEASETQ